MKVLVYASVEEEGRFMNNRRWVDCVSFVIPSNRQQCALDGWAFPPPPKQDIIHRQVIRGSRSMIIFKSFITLESRRANSSLDDCILIYRKNGVPEVGCWRSDDDNYALLIHCGAFGTCTRKASFSKTVIIYTNRRGRSVIPSKQWEDMWGERFYALVVCILLFFVFKWWHNKGKMGAEVVKFGR